MEKSFDPNELKGLSQLWWQFKWGRKEQISDQSMYFSRVQVFVTRKNNIYLTLNGENHLTVSETNIDDVCGRIMSMVAQETEVRVAIAA